MGALSRLRHLRVWLAFFTLACCLPSLGMAGNGWCPLLGTPSPAPNGLHHCAGCCLPGAGMAQPIPARPSVPDLPCCQRVQAFLSVDLELSKLKVQELASSSAGGPALLDLLAPLFSGVGSFDAYARPVFRESATPPSIFLSLVSRRCFPTLAPPGSVALLS